MTVSNEDREAAIQAVAEAIYGPAYGKASKEKADRVLAALVSHGWGPKPTVLAATLENVLVGKWPGGTRVLRRDLIAYLRECGIEVTE